MAEVEILLADVTVDVIELDEVEARALVAGFDEAEVTRARNDVARALRQRPERIIEQIDRRDDARRAFPIGVQHLRTGERKLAMFVPEARGHLTEREDPFVALQSIEKCI